MERIEKILIAGIVGIAALVLVTGSGYTGFLTGNCKTVLENVTELLPYSDKLCGQSPIVENQCQSLDYKYSLYKSCFASESVFNVQCTLTNFEDKSGDFGISYGIIDKNGNRTGEEQNVSLNAKESQTFRFSKDVGVGNCYCELTSTPKKDVCFDVLKTQEQCYDVTKYKEVVTNRNVTKCS